jgi:large subunit ribosomal protein L11
MVQKIEVLVDAGKVSGGPPLGPALGPMGLNIGEVIAKINEETAKFTGMKVPITLIIDLSTKKYEVKVGTPPTSSLILKEVGAEKGSGDPLRDKIGDMTMEQVRKIAEMKLGSTLSNSLEGAMKEVIGTCISVGVTVDGKDPREIKNLINRDVS